MYIVCGVAFAGVLLRKTCIRDRNSVDCFVYRNIHQPQERMHLFGQILCAIVAMLVPNIGGFLNGYFITRPNIESWYQYLNQPPGSPPNWLFAPVWIIIYCAIGLASFFVWRSAHAPYTTVTRTAFWWTFLVYVLQILINWLWTPVFFKWHHLLAVS